MTAILGLLIDEAAKLRFWAKVQKRGEDECWPWLGSIDKYGYGQFKIGGRKGKSVRTHRVVAAITSDAFDEAAHYLHSCDNRRCCNPKHISAGSHQQNMDDMVKRSRTHSPRPGNGHTKLDTADRYVVALLVAVGRSKSEVGRRLGVTASRIRQIVKEIA